MNYTRLNKSQMMDRIVKLEALLESGLTTAKQLKHGGRTVEMRVYSDLDSFIADAQGFLDLAEKEGKRGIHGNMTIHFSQSRNPDLTPERQERIVQNLLDSFDRADIGASYFHSSFCISYEEEEVSDWVNIYYDKPTTKAERVVKRWMNASAKVGFPTKLT